MKNLKVLIAAVVFGIFCANAYAASFDCKLAKTAVEKAVCSDKELSADDDKLAAAYKAALAAVPADIQVEIRGNERAFDKHIATQCSAGEDGIAQADVVNCLKQTYVDQTALLSKWTVQINGTTFVQHWTSQRLKSSDPQAAALGEDPGYGTLIDFYPQAQSNSPDLTAWNAEVKAKTLAISKLDKNSDSNVMTTLDAVTPQMVAATISLDYDGHGTHPDESSRQLNWLLKEHRAAQSADIFKPDTNFAAILEAQCRASLNAGVGADYEDFLGKPKFATTLHGIVLLPANWQLSPKGLTVVFQDYQLESHAERPENVTVPWSALQADLNPNFVVPR